MIILLYLLTNYLFFYTLYTTTITCIHFCWLLYKQENKFLIFIKIYNSGKARRK